jgi:hypothetical protein
MQQPPRSQSSRALRSRRTQPALPGAALPTTPVYVSAAHRQRWPQLPARKGPSGLKRALFWLCVPGLLLCLCAFLSYPLIFESLPDSSAARALLGTFPWLARLFWTNQAPFLVTLLAHVSWLNLQAGSSTLAAANLLGLVLVAACVCLFLAARICQRTVRDRLSSVQMRWLLVLICGFTFLLGVLFLFLPGGLSQDILLYGLDGRLITVYHVNPYLVNPGMLVHDSLYRALTPGAFTLPLVGPLWLDLTVPVAALTQGNPAFVWLGFRLLGLLLHLCNALLIWTILARLKPEARLGGTLLYAWNPIILLLGVSEMHADMAVIFFLLLGVLFLQRHAFLLSWICLLLAVLINPLCLLLLPLFLRVLNKETRIFSSGRRVLWWISLLILSGALAILAYAPYWSGLGTGGIADRLRQVFWPDTAQHSLLAAFASLPFASWAPAGWLLTPHHWMILPLILVGFVLLLGIWITDNLELALLFSGWIFLALAILEPISSPWVIVLPLALTLVSSSHRTSLLAHLLVLGALLAYYLALAGRQWDGQALATIGIPALIWGWTLFFISTWEMTHHDEDEEVVPVQPAVRRRGLSRPSWPSRPAAWPSRPGQRQSQEL